MTDPDSVRSQLSPLPQKTEVEGTTLVRPPDPLSGCGELAKLIDVSRVTTSRDL